MNLHALCDLGKGYILGDMQVDDALLVQLPVFVTQGGCFALAISLRLVVAWFCILGRKRETLLTDSIEIQGSGCWKGAQKHLHPKYAC